MKNILYQSKYQEVTYFVESNVVVITWTADSQDMDDETYKQEILNFASSYQDIQPKGFLSDMRQFYYTITPEIQEWVAGVFKSDTDEGNRQVKSGLVVSSDIFSQVSLEQTIGEIDKNVDTGTRYFSDFEEALAWIKS